MSNPYFNRFGGNTQYNNRGSQNENILSQFARLKNNPGEILDIMLRNGKINQQQYNDLQLYRDNPEAIGKYLINNGMGGDINRAQQVANQYK